MIRYCKKGYNKILSISAFFFFITAIILTYVIPQPIYAAVTKVVLRIDRHTASTDLSGSACIQTSTSGTESSLTITFPSTFTINTTTTNWTMDTSSTNIPTGATQWASTSSGNAQSVSGQAVTFTVGDVSASTFTCMHFTTTASTSNTGTAGNDKTGSIATNIDSATSYATSIVSSGGDQITVTASVPATFTFSLGGATAALGSLSTSAVTSAAGVSATVSTNARLGWGLWVHNSSNGLYSTVASTAISAPGAYGSTFDLSSTTGYGLDVNAGSGTPTIDTAYDGAGDTNNVGVLQSTFKPIATKATAGSGDLVTLRFRAKVSATQASASDYTDTVTVAAAGNF